MTIDILPADRSPLERFRDHLRRGELAYQFDPSAHRPVFYPRVLGPGTGASDLEWRVCEGGGTVYAVTVISPRGETPYNVVLVDMDEGFRLMSRVDGVEAAAVRIGMRVRMRAHVDSEGAAPYPVFVPEVA
jgi:uncharacterized OB-fold protein